MSEPTALLSASPEAGPSSARPTGLLSKYREDHSHPVNHFLHVGVGWPMAAAAVLLLPFRPWWTLGLFLGAYAVMFFGHFAFERNIPTIFKHPSTPFVVAWSVIRKIGGGMLRLVGPRPAR